MNVLLEFISQPFNPEAVLQTLDLAQSIVLSVYKRSRLQYRQKFRDRDACSDVMMTSSPVRNSTDPDTSVDFMTSPVKSRDHEADGMTSSVKSCDSEADGMTSPLRRSRDVNEMSEDISLGK